MVEAAQKQLADLLKLSSGNGFFVGKEATERNRAHVRVVQHRRFEPYNPRIIKTKRYRAPRSEKAAKATKAKCWWEAVKELRSE